MNGPEQNRLRPLTWIALTVAMVTCMGAVVLATGLAMGFLGGRALPAWSPLRYGVTALLTGVAYVVLEILWAPFGRALVDRDTATDPVWKRSLRLLSIFVVITGLVTTVECAFSVMGLHL